MFVRGGFQMNFSRVIWAVPAALLLVGILGAAAPVTVWNQKDVAGLWWSPKKDSKIKIYRKDDKYYGKIVWMLPKDKGKLDVKNHDPQKRTQKILGLDIFFGFVFDGKNIWKDGRIYDPQSGDTYDGSLKLEEKNVLAVSGFISIPIIGRIGGSEKFKRVGLHDPLPTMTTPALIPTQTPVLKKTGTPSKPK
jgi:uncharacterized protein (DUF2147 family)